MNVEKSRDLFEEWFVPETSYELLREQFKNLFQGGMGVQQYANHFNKLVLFSNKDVLAETSRVVRFHRG